MNNNLLIAIVGHPSTGKDTAAHYVVDKYGLNHVSLSDFLRAYIKENNLGEPDRDRMHEIGDSLRREHGGDYLMRLAIEKSKRPAILTSVRVIKEAETFKKAGGILVAITAPIELRYKRAVERGDVKDTVTFEKFKAQEEAEAANLDPIRMNVDGVIKMADYTIENSGTREEMFGKVDEILNKKSNG